MSQESSSSIRENPSGQTAGLKPNAWRRRFRLLLGGLLLLFLLYGLAVNVVLDIALTPRRKTSEHTPITDGLPAELITFQSDNLTLRGYLIKTSSDKALILLHGLDGYGWSGFHRDLARFYWQQGFNVLLFDLRGHGESDGSSLGLGYKERDDVRAAADLLLKRGFSDDRIVIHGTSYGGATALLSAAAIPEIAAVVADSPFADFRHVLERELKRRVGPAALFRPGLTLGLTWRFHLEPDVVSPLANLPHIAPRPIFFLHGEADTRIPVSESQLLMSKATWPMCALWTIPGAEHTKAYGEHTLEYQQRVSRFLNQVVP